MVQLIKQATQTAYRQATIKEKKKKQTTYVESENKTAQRTVTPYDQEQQSKGEKTPVLEQMPPAYKKKKTMFDKNVIDNSNVQ